MKYSIVIPTYNHCDDLLKPCLASIFKYTDLADVEIIISANGCTDNTKLFLESIQDKVKYIWSDEALGYPKAVNLGLQMASSEYVVLLNNDTVLLPQEKNYWLDLLRQPFDNSSRTGITGPVKFTWPCGSRTYPAMAFWLVMIKKSLFDELGLLDEIFSPGMGEDGDFCVKAVNKGYTLVSVPENTSAEFGHGVADNSFPIFHLGNGTFADNHEHKNQIIERNDEILVERYGQAEVSIIIPTYNHLEDALRPCIETLITYTDFTNKEVIVVANGCIDGTNEYLDQYKDFIKVIWFDEPTGVVRAYNAGIDSAIGKYIVLLDNDCVLMWQRKDEWIDTLKKPFLEDALVGAAGPFAHEYKDMGLVLHSGCTMYRADILRQVEKFDEIYNPGYFCDPDVAMKIWKAGYKCVEVPEYNNNKHYENNVFRVNFPVIHLGEIQTMNKNKDIELVKRNREILYSRYGKKTNKKYSIVIPTYNHCDDLLKPCIESIFQYTDPNLIEVIVVANGCTDNTREFVENYKEDIILIWSNEALGYPKAVNLGIQRASGEYVVLLNNDTVLLPQYLNAWVEMLNAPFSDPTVGICGPLELFDNYANSEAIIFFCVMIRSELFDKVGLLDEIYSPGGGEDIDFSMRIKNLGYRITTTGGFEYSPEERTNIGDFPIWHKDNRTFRDIPEYKNEIVKTNGLINCKKYNKNIKLNLGAGGIEYPGYLSVDLYDHRAHIMMDITNLDFDENSVTEILASHVFEHLNPYHALDILKRWLRVLKPGGKLIMEMPDIEALCKRFVTADTGERYGILNAVYGSVNTTDVGGPDNITSPHLFGWWPQSMFDHLVNAGYTNIQFMDEKIPHPESNFRVEASKPMPTFNRETLRDQEPGSYVEIFDQNIYAVEDHEVRDNTVIDIGANLGMFSIFCAEKGAKNIYAIEAQPVVYNIGLLDNAQHYENIIPLNYAVYDSDDQQVHILNHHVGSRVGGTEGDIVRTITLKTLLERQNIQETDMLLKMDCEGSEFNILLSTDKDTLRRFKTIHMEIHGNTNPVYKDSNLIRSVLSEYGFYCDKKSDQFAVRTESETVYYDVFVEKWVRI